MLVSQQRQSDDDRAVLVEMAAMWLRLADFADKSDDGYTPPPAA